MKIVKGLLKEGLGKQAIFDRASEYGLAPKKVSKYLAMIPDEDDAKKYNKANNILIGIYSLFVLLGLLGMTTMFSGLSSAMTLGLLTFAILFHGTFIYYIYKKRSIVYPLLCLFLMKGILDSINEFAMDPMAAYIGIAINSCLIIYIAVLKTKLFPYQNFLNTKKNAEGITLFTKDLQK